MYIYETYIHICVYIFIKQEYIHILAPFPKSNIFDNVEGFSFSRFLELFQVRVNQIIRSKAPGWIHGFLNNFQLRIVSLGSVGWLAAMEDHQNLMFTLYF